MKTFRFKGRVMTNSSYPHSIFIDVKVDAKDEREASDKLWDMFNHPIGAEWEIKEVIY